MANEVLIDRINDSFISLMVQEKSKAYASYIKAINRQLIDEIDGLNAKRVREIVRNQDINIDDVMLLFAIQNAVILILENRQEAKKNDKITPILVVMGMYTIAKPKLFVKKMIKINKGIGLSKREKIAQSIIKQFRNDNAKVLASARKQAIRNMQESIFKSKRNKRMLQDFRQLTKEGKSIESIKNTLVRRYNKLSKVNIALDTELHAQSEYVRQAHSRAIGYTHKLWKTQGDERVRDTCFHNQVNNKRVPIESDFRACGLRAQYPGDERLPAGERIRCRCYLIYGQEK